MVYRLFVFKYQETTQLEADHFAMIRGTADGLMLRKDHAT